MQLKNEPRQIEMGLIVIVTLSLKKKMAAPHVLTKRVKYGHA